MIIYSAAKIVLVTWLCLMWHLFELLSTFPAALIYFDIKTLDNSNDNHWIIFPSHCEESNRPSTLN